MAVWLDVGDAPRSGCQFVGRFKQRDGQPPAEQRVTVAVWNEYEDGWVAAKLACDADEPGSFYVETDFVPGILTGWQHLPEFEQMSAPSLPPFDRVLLLDVGYPWPVLGRWCAAFECFVHAELQASHCNGKLDLYFESETFRPCGVRAANTMRWMSLPAPDPKGVLCPKRQ